MISWSLTGNEMGNGNLFLTLDIRGSAKSKVQGSLWTPELIENGKLGVLKKNIGVPTRVVLVINNQVFIKW